MLFKKKQMYEYKVLEKCKIDIEEACRSSDDVCELVGKDDHYAFYRYNFLYIVRQEINNTKKVVFFGKGKEFNIVYKGYLFQVDKYGEFRRFGITARNCETGQLIEYDWIAQKAVFLVTPDLYGRYFSQDSVEDVYIKDDKLYFKCYREQSLDPDHKATKPDRYDVTAEFTLKVEEKAGQFIATALFDDRDVLSEEEAKRRFLEIKDKEWYKRGRERCLDARMKRSNKENECQPEETETKTVVNKDIEKKTSVVNTSAKSEVVSSQKHEAQKKKYWLSEDGTVKCPGDACPIDCDTDCPIYAQTLALEKLTKDDFEGAAKLLRNATTTEPKFADAWNNLAACYGQMGDHKNAFVAYQRSYEIQQKPNPLYGMAVATKNMKDYTLSEMFIDTYIKKFGSDDRINSLKAETSENALYEKINDSAKKESAILEKEQSISTESKSNQIREEESTQGNSSLNQDSESWKTETSIDDMRRYGKYMLLLLDPDMREAGYAAMEKLVGSYPEAGVIVGQYYNGQDQQKAKQYFKIAADAGIVEGQWGYASIIPHSSIPDDFDVIDKEWMKYCLAAAEGGNPDAAHELGNICHRKGCIAEAAYWYGMAYFMEQPQALVSIKGIIQEWTDAGKPENYRVGTENYTKERHNAAIDFLKSMTGTNMVGDLMVLCIGGETFAGLTAAYLFEQAKSDELAYKAYSILASGKHPHVLRCYADMLIAGKGTPRDVDGAFRMYEQAAKAGNAVAMFAMGQKAVKDGDKHLAACWFGQAYARGVEMAGDWLSKLAEG